MSANPPLRVLRFISSRRGDAERGPAVWMNPDEASLRLILEGELAWVYGPSRHELATMQPHTIAAALGQDPEHELMALFARALNELGTRNFIDLLDYPDDAGGNARVREMLERLL